MSEMSPEAFGALLDAARAGGAWAFERLYLMYRQPVHGYLRSQGVADPDDLHGECFLRAFHALSGFSGTEPRFRSWLFAIAHNLVIDDRRARSRRRPIDVTGADADRRLGPDAADLALAAIGFSALRQLVEQLPSSQRDVVLLRSVADLTVEQVAEATGRSPGAVKQLQRRGLDSLRRALSPEGVTL